MVDSMIAQVRESGAELRLGELATPATVRALAPCGVFLACGARPIWPAVPGIDCEHVVTAENVLTGRVAVQGDCVIVGSGMTGLETAEKVLAAGHRTTIADLLPRIGMSASPLVMHDLQEHLAPHQPNYLPGHRLIRIVPRGAEFEVLETGLSLFVPAETVILALGVRPDEELVASWKAAFPEVHVLGDAAHGGRIIDATQDAFGQAFHFEP